MRRPPLYIPGNTRNALGQRVDTRRTNRLHALLRLGLGATDAVGQVLVEMPL